MKSKQLDNRPITRIGKTKKPTARTPNTFIRNEPAPFNFSGDFPLEANSLSAYNYNFQSQYTSKQNFSSKNGNYKVMPSIPSLQEPEFHKQ